MEDDIFIQRSPMLFKHVLAYIIDDMYPYPVEYYSELDFYGINYDKDKLFHKMLIL